VVGENQDVNHPYIEYEGSALWRTIDAEIGALEDNQDLALLTARTHAVGAICRRLGEAGLILLHALRRPDA
jgi:hypothetical protein